MAQIPSSLPPVNLFSDDRRKKTKFLTEDPGHSGRSSRRWRRKGTRRMMSGRGMHRKDGKEEEEEKERSDVS